MRKEGTLSQPIGDVMRAEDDLIRVGIPQAAHAAFCGRLRVRLIIPKQETIGRLRFVQDVGAKLVALRVVARIHLCLRLRRPQRRLLSRRQTLRASMTAALTVRAPAKINLTLEILARRKDGYHGVRTLM